jgi:hypothetical protein
MSEQPLGRCRSSRIGDVKLLSAKGMSHEEKPKSRSIRPALLSLLRRERKPIFVDIMPMTVAEWDQVTPRELLTALAGSHSVVTAPPSVGAPRVPTARDRNATYGAVYGTVCGISPIRADRRRSGHRVLPKLWIRSGRTNGGDVNLCRGRPLNAPPTFRALQHAELPDLGAITNRRTSRSW